MADLFIARERARQLTPPTPLARCAAGPMGGGLSEVLNEVIARRLGL